MCLRADRKNSAVIGWATTPAVDLLGADRGSWLDAIPLLSERAAFGRAVVGWAALPLAFLLLVAAWVLVVRLAPRTKEAAVDGRAIRTVGLIALLLGSAFAITTPAMEAPDEMVHLHLRRPPARPPGATAIDQDGPVVPRRPRRS